MQYISETANVAMTNICQTSVPQRKSLANDPLIQRTREILIIILSVLLVSVFYDDLNNYFDIILLGSFCGHTQGCWNLRIWSPDL